MFKRKISLITLIFMLMSLACTSAMSALRVNAEEEIAVTREQWIHSLAEAFSLEVEDQSRPDNYYPDLMEDDEYYDDMIIGIHHGLLDVTAGENVEPAAAASREFAAHTLNMILDYRLEDSEAFTFSDSGECLYPADDQIAVNQNWLSLVSGKFLPSAAITQAEADAMITAGKAALEVEVIDYNYENTYELNLKPDTVEIPEGTEYLWLDGETLQIRNCPAVLTEGTDFVIHMGDIIGAYHALSVVTEADITTVTVEKAADDDLITDIDAQGDLDLSNIYIEPGEGMELYYIDIHSGESYESLPEMITASTMASKGTIDLSSVEIKGTGKIKIDDTFSVKAGFTLSDTRIEYKLNIKDSVAYVRMSGNLEFDYKVEASLSEMLKAVDNVKILYFGIPGIGGFAVSTKVEAKGTIGGKISSDIKLGIAYQDGGVRGISKFSNKQCSSTAEATGAIGLKMSFGVNDIPGDIVVADVYLEGGAKASIKDEVFADGKAPARCVHFAAYLYAETGFEGKIKTFFGSVEGKAYKTIYDDKNSPAKIVKHYEDGRQVPACTRGLAWDDKYYTGGGSIFADSGWSGGDNSWLLGPGGEPYCIFGYQLDEDGNATITSYEGNMRNLTIPDTLDDHKVIAIGKNVFKGNSLITTVNFPESVKTIDNSAFMNCSNLSWINFAEGLETIGYQSFAGCSSLSLLELPDSVSTIDAGAFAKCPKLAKVILSKGLVKMNAHAFFDDDRLTSIEIPKSLKEGDKAYIYEYAYDYQWGPFYGCDGLKTITFEEGTTEITQGLFANCPGIEVINVPDTITTIEANAFINCENLSTLNFTDGLTFIGSTAFANNPLITSVNIPDSVVTIDSGAFGNCQNLSEVKLSKSLVEMNAHAFYNDDKLTSIEIPKTLKEGGKAYINAFAYDYQWGPFYGCDGLSTITFEEGTTEITQGLFANCPGFEEINIPDTVTVIEANAFQNCRKLAKINFTDGLTKIGYQSFASCVKLTEVNMPDTVVLVDAGAFAKCETLEKVSLSKTLKTLNAHAFFDDDALAEVFIPKSLKEGGTAYIYEYAYDYQWGPFFGCDGLKTIVFEEGVSEITQGLFANCPGIEEIVIPDTVTTLESNCFLKATGLKKVTLSQNLVSLGTSSFNGCKSLEAIEIPDTVTSFGSYVCNGCTNLKTAKLPAGLTYVRDHTFSECSSLESITLPEPVTEIKDEAFMNCKSLAAINWNSNIQNIGFYAFENNDALTELVIPDTVTSIVKGAFYDCDGLTSVVIPDSVTSMGERIFYTCELLKDVRLGAGMKYIPTETFYECPALEEIEIPYGVTEIRGTAFANCTGLVKITIPRTVTAINTAALSYPAKTVIYGVSGTYAETFANDNGFKFVAIDVPAEKVTLSETDVILMKGKTAKLVMTIEPGNCTDERSWKSSDQSIVTVEDGTIKGISLGTATVKATVGKLSANATVTVVQPVTRIDLNTSSVSLEAFDTYQFTAAVLPENAYNKNIEWVSSDAEIVSVDQNGLATALKKGSAYVYARALDGSGTERSARVTVTSNGYLCTSVDELESEHNYPDNSNDYWLYKAEGAEKLYVTFDERTAMEDGFDYIYIYDAEGNEIGKYTGTELAGATIEIPGDTVRIRLVSDDGTSDWGFKVKDIQAIGAHDHAYGTPEYTWSDDNTTVTAKAACSICGNEITETVETSYEVIKEATETETGLGRYTAAFSNELFETQTKDVEIPVKGHEHEYGEPEYTWSADNSNVTARAECTGCDDAVTETVRTTYEVIKEPTKTQTGTGRYTAAFTNKLFETQSKDVTIPALGIVYPESIKLDQNEAMVAYNRTLQLKAAVLPENADDKTVTWSSSNESIAAVAQNGTVTPKGVGTVTITAKTVNGLYDTCEIRVLFSDVANSSQYFFEPVYWAVDNNITVGAGGAGKFSPNNPCTREQIVTFLWRLMGEPEPETQSKFTDVSSDAWYYKPITWAAEKGITTGLNDGTGRFGVGQPCTREQCVTFLYRTAGEPEVGSHEAFTDVAEGRYYYDSISWAASKGITVGLNDGTGRFGVGQKCTRAMIVTFLYRFANQ